MPGAGRSGPGTSPKRVNRLRTGYGKGVPAQLPSLFLLFLAVPLGCAGAPAPVPFDPSNPCVALLHRYEGRGGVAGADASIAEGRGPGEQACLEQARVSCPGQFVAAADCKAEPRVVLLVPDPSGKKEWGGCFSSDVCSNERESPRKVVHFSETSTQVRAAPPPTHALGDAAICVTF